MIRVSVCTCVCPTYPSVQSTLTLHLFTEHSNFIGVDEVYGPVAISLRRDKVEEDLPPTVGGPTIKHFYRIIVRTCQV